MKTITPTITLDPSQLKDDLETSLTSHGLTLKDVERYQRQVEYRRQYSLRPDVKEKRREYSRQRNLKMRILRDLLSKEV
jgi:hypothetical protein